MMSSCIINGLIRRTVNLSLQHRTSFSVQRRWLSSEGEDKQASITEPDSNQQSQQPLEQSPEQLSADNVAEQKDKTKSSGFAEASAKFTQLINEMKASEKAQVKSEQSIQSPAPEKEIPFATLLRRSSFIQLGDCEGKIVAGTIYHVIEDDLYIDFGGKFPCVCKRPANGVEFVRGAKVKLRLNDWELSARFLGSSKDMTLLEADCTLLGLISSPVVNPNRQKRSKSQSSENVN